MRDAFILRRIISPTMFMGMRGISYRMRSSRVKSHSEGSCSIIARMNSIMQQTMKAVATYAPADGHGVFGTLDGVVDIPLLLRRAGYVRSGEEYSLTAVETAQESLVNMVTAECGRGYALKWMDALDSAIDRVSPRAASSDSPYRSASIVDEVVDAMEDGSILDARWMIMRALIVDSALEDSLTAFQDANVVTLGGVCTNPGDWAEAFLENLGVNRCAGPAPAAVVCARNAILARYAEGRFLMRTVICSRMYGECRLTTSVMCDHPEDEL